MKKAKVMLAAITILAVVGGALAFKAQTFNTKFLYYTTNSGADCLTSIATTASNAGGTINTPSDAPIATWFKSKELGVCVTPTDEVYTDPS